MINPALKQPFKGVIEVYAQGGFLFLVGMIFLNGVLFYLLNAKA